MADIVEAFNALLFFISVLFVGSASLTLGMALVCKALKWAPVNITIKHADIYHDSKEP